MALLSSGTCQVSQKTTGREGGGQAGTYQIRQSLVISCTVSAVSGHLLYCVHSLWSSPVLVRSLWSSLYCVRSLWSSPVLCLQCLVISCTVSAVSGHLLYYVCSLWSSPVLCLQSLVISCNM
ncbi:unnamed protein product, partial [Staurois parvus]